MNGHEQFAEDLALHAMHALEGPELAALEAHLAQCATCRSELESCRGDLALLALSTSGPKPPLRARERLLRTIAAEKASARPWHMLAPHDTGWLSGLAWVAAAAMLLLAVALWQENGTLKQSLAELRVSVGSDQAELQRVRETLAALSAPEAQHITLVAAQQKAQPQGRAIYLRASGRLIFLASGMPALPPQKAYELWLLPLTGNPVPAGVFKPDARGSAVVVNPPLPVGLEAKGFAITVEPEAGSALPTSTPSMVGLGS
jgi:anti-sigma-K factor RskA